MSNSSGSNGRGRAAPERGRRRSSCRRSSPGWPAPGCRWRRAWRPWPRSCPGAGSAARWSTWPTAWNRGGRWARRSTSRAARIPPHLRGLVIAGIRSGRLGEILGEFSGVCQHRGRAEAAIAAEPRLSDRQLPGHPAVSRRDIAWSPSSRPSSGTSGCRCRGSPCAVRRLANGVVRALVYAHVVRWASRWPAFWSCTVPPDRRRSAAWLRASAAGRRLAVDVAGRVLPLARPAAGAPAPPPRGPPPGGRRRAGRQRPVRSPPYGHGDRGGKTLSEAGRAPAVPAATVPAPPLGRDQRTLPEVLHMAGDMFEARGSAHSSSPGPSWACRPSS